MSGHGTFDGAGWAPDSTGGIVVRDWTLTFDYPRPPLTANQRMHWRPKAAVTASVRLAARLLAAQIPPLGRCKVSLVWFVTTKHRRDVDNIVPTLKAMCDGLVDAGIVTDDTPAFMVKVMPAITLGPKACMQLRVEAIA